MKGLIHGVLFLFTFQITAMTIRATFFSYQNLKFPLLVLKYRYHIALFFSLAKN